MPIIDLDLETDSSLQNFECDICIIGSGPAGSTIAREFADTDQRVILLESGGFQRNPQADQLNEVENIGRPRIVDQWAVRNRIVGGSSHTWGGRCAGFDAIDFEVRAWVPNSGWPIGLSDMSPYLERSAPYLGLMVGTGFSDDRFWTLAGRPHPRSNPDPHALLPFFWQFSRDGEDEYLYEYMRFGRRLTIGLAANITLIANATALRIIPVESARAVQSVEFTGPDGATRILSAPTVVVCGGGVENARILLASNSVTTNGLGNEHDVVGRYLMDHPRGTIGTFSVKGSEALQKRFGRYNVNKNLFRAGLRLSPDVQRSEGLLNCAAWLGEIVAKDDPLDAIKRMLRRKPQLPSDLTTILSNYALILRGVKDYFIEHNGLPRKLEALTLDCMCEQRPDRDSRITLSDRRDRFGIPLSRIDWRVHPDESRSMRRMAQLAAEQFVNMGLPQLELADWVRDGADFPPEFMDVGHPTGTTRMADNPAKGVVDSNCMVHGVDCLYVSGSSVFPTAGHCNPTQMIVAMALRLADHLKARAAAVRPIDLKTQEAGIGPNTTRVLVTGATGRIGRVVVLDLLARGYRVRAISSKPKAELSASTDVLEWQSFDFMTSTDYDGLVAGCDAIVHLAAELGKMERMPKVNLDATRSLAQAAERAGVKALCYISSVSVYGSGRARVMTEDSPVLTVDRDIRSEYWALDYVRMYGRTKLAGERAIADAARKVRYVVLRPTVVVDIHQIIGIRDWSVFKRNLCAHRHAHHVYVLDVSDAIIWSVERALNGAGAPGSVETFNLSDDEFSEPTHAEFMSKAYAVSKDPRFRIFKVPGVVDWLHDFLRFHTLPLRNPLWRMRFPNDRLHAAGFRFRFGMKKANALALDTLRSKSNSEIRSHARELTGQPVGGMFRAGTVNQINIQQHTPPAGGTE